MKTIPLTQGKFAIVDDDDYERVMQFKWHAVQVTKGYWYAKSNNVYLHRFITGAEKGNDVDHVDRDGLNNVRKNIRVCEHSKNLLNQRKRISTKNTSKYKGVTRHYNQWVARIKVGRKNLYIGGFQEEKDAASAYDLAARRYRGEFATLNFPS